jgi:hypothetical protein
VVELDAGHDLTAHDPLAQGAELVWYVRPPTGGQYGPARGEVMRRWIDEGRICPDCLVWREGWTEWLQAGHVFAGLDSGDPPYAAMLTPPPVPSGKESTPDVREVARPRRRSSGLGKSIAAILFLGLLVVALLVALILVQR